MKMPRSGVDHRTCEFCFQDERVGEYTEWIGADGDTYCAMLCFACKRDTAVLHLLEQEVIEKGL